MTIFFASHKWKIAHKEECHNLYSTCRNGNEVREGYKILKGPGVKLTTHLNLLLRLGMCGAIPPLPLYLHSMVLS
jgi:hypothetical protein